jgi:SagB-type dehydrogenase family enzyme
MMKTIRLPQPRLDSGVSVERALQQRRSARNFGAAAITLDETAQLLWSAQGITHPDGLRAAPSAGALYPLELFLVAGNVTGLEPAVYRYSPSGHALTLVAQGDLRASVAQAALGQQWMQKAPAILVFCAVEKRTTRKYGNRGISYIYIEAGHAAQNVFLQAQALGLGAAAVGAFNEAQTASLLHLPGEQKPLYLMPAGRVE